MDNEKRAQLELLTVAGLREVALRYGLDTQGVREVLLDRLIDYFDRRGWPDQIIAVGRASQEDKNLFDMANIVNPSVAANGMERDESLRRINMQEIVEAVV